MSKLTEHSAPGFSMTQMVAHPKIAKAVRKAVQRFERNYGKTITKIRLGPAAFTRFRLATPCSTGEPPKLTKMYHEDKISDGDRDFFTLKMTIGKETKNRMVILATDLREHEMYIHAEKEDAPPPDARPDVEGDDG